MYKKVIIDNYLKDHFKNITQDDNAERKRSEIFI